MEKFNENIKVIAIEAIAQSRVILTTDEKIQEGLGLQIVLFGDNLEVQEELYKIDDITTFNAFEDITEEETSDNYKELLFRKLSDEQVQKINELLK